MAPSPTRWCARWKHKVRSASSPRGCKTSTTSSRATSIAASAVALAVERTSRLPSLASERWAEASIAAGTDAAEAQGAAARVTDAYTGQPAS